MHHAMNIGEAAEAAGVSTKMIRHYEQIGLLPAAARTDAGYRQYAERDVSVLRFIRQARRLGFSIEQIAELLGLWSDAHRASRSVKAVAQRHVADLAQKMRELADMKQALERLVASCHGDDHPHCAILAELAVQSPAAPVPGSIEPGTLRKPASARRPAAAKARPPAAPAPAPHHAGLMAWTHQLHQRHGGS
ncbi:Cu(I)-responsive transcriptional regulator [Rubrivivax sp. RP6-9]|uniref:Cu(I)-responsive transcriptional regulator n=1 Tax=Rubrivivax sp. RP6-9 TaxID=3415750 RepID=UPI003CC552A5